MVPTKSISIQQRTLPFVREFCGDRSFLCFETLPKRIVIDSDTEFQPKGFNKPPLCNLRSSKMECADQLAENSLKEAMAELSKKLGLFERVRHVCQSEAIPLPGVVVVGEQSAGKSSLLENISGIQFPRAQNTCTRMPCVLTLLTDLTLQESFAKVSMDSSFVDVPWSEVAGIKNNRIPNSQCKAYH